MWHEQRRFALRYLRDFGFGRRFDTLEKEVEIQIAQCIDIVKNGPKHRFERVSAFSIKFIFFFQILTSKLNELKCAALKFNFKEILQKRQYIDAVCFWSIVWKLFDGNIIE